MDFTINNPETPQNPLTFSVKYYILSLSYTDACVASAATTAGHAESYACGVRLRPQPVARETEAGNAI